MVNGIEYKFYLADTNELLTTVCCIHPPLKVDETISSLVPESPADVYRVTCIKHEALSVWVTKEELGGICPK